MIDISSGQARMLEAIRSYWDLHRYSPSIRDLMLATGISSSNGVTDHLRALERKGYITRRKGLSRSIVVTESPGAGDIPAARCWERPEGSPRAQWRMLYGAVIRECGVPVRSDVVRAMVDVAWHPAELVPYLSPAMGERWLAACAESPRQRRLDVDELAIAERELRSRGAILADLDTDQLAPGPEGLPPVGAHGWADGRARFVVRAYELNPRAFGARHAA